MLNLNPSVTAEEAAHARNAGNLTLAGLAIENGIRELYSSPLSICVDGKSDYQRMICLYLFLYAADYWCSTSCNVHMTEAEYIAVIGKIEELQQECCDYKIEGTVVPAEVMEIPSGSSSSGVATFILEFNATQEQEDDEVMTITDSRFANVRVSVVRGLLTLPGIVQLEDNLYFTKTLASTTVVLSHPLVKGEYIKITTIPL